MPSHRHISELIAFRTGIDREDIDTYESTQFFIEGEVVRTFGRGRLGSVYLRLLQEEFTIGEEDSRSRLLLPGIQYAQRRYDDPLRPRKGYLYRLEVRGTHQVLGSDTGLLQLLVSANALRPLPWGLSVFARVQAGTTWQNEPLREIPPSLRFFAGGDQSVRGYAYQSLGPRDSSGEVVGGKHLLVGSVELERPLSENWGLALFFDAGNAFDSFSDYEIFEGAGCGLRRYTPVGPLKVDLARQIGVSDPSYRLHVSIGFTW
jgi:translocation and assembly module TamA